MDKKKYDIILIGPQMGGKTALLRTLKGEKPQEHMATQSNGEPKKVSLGNFFKRINPFHKDKVILDAGGKYNEFEKYSSWCKETKMIVYVFNGCELLNEIKNYANPGKNTSFCRRVCAGLDNEANICFVATHQDLYQGEDMVGSIQRALEKANEEYGKVFPNLTKRYHPFSKLMNGRLFSVNALDAKEVMELFDKIFEL